MNFLSCVRPFLMNKTRQNNLGFRPALPGDISKTEKAKGIKSLVGTYFIPRKMLS